MTLMIGPAAKNGTVTLRERDRAEIENGGQLIGQMDEVVEVMSKLVDGSMTWQDASQRLEVYNGIQDV